MVVGKRVAPPPGTTVRLEIPEAGLAWSVRVGDDGRAAAVDDDLEPTTTVALRPEDYVVLSGGRRIPEATEPQVTGDKQLGLLLVESLAVTP
jgi:hypothetical protein